MSRPPDSPARVPGLDGVRALAILAVLFSHSVVYDQFTPLRSAGRAAGSAGVAVFFVLSGYLITTVLLREEESAGAVSLRHFYLRRAVRLFPALWLYLAVVWVLWVSGALPHHPWRSFVASLLYARNLVGSGHETEHLWSLSVEEQFYLLWPVAFVALRGRNRLRLTLAVAGVVAVTFWRYYAAGRGLLSAGELYSRTDFRFDAPLYGCALALLMRVAPVPAVRRGGLLAGVAVLGIVLWAGSGLGGRLPAGLDYTAVCLLGSLLVLSQTGPARGWPAWGPLGAVGRISYGLYLWQQLFLGPREGIFGGVRLFPIGLPAAFAAACLSYHFLERPLLRRAGRQTRHTPSEITTHPEGTSPVGVTSR